MSKLNVLNDLILLDHWLETNKTPASTLKQEPYMIRTFRTSCSSKPTAVDFYLILFAVWAKYCIYIFQFTAKVSWQQAWDKSINEDKTLKTWQTKVNCGFKFTIIFCRSFPQFKFLLMRWQCAVSFSCMLLRAVSQLYDGWKRRRYLNVRHCPLL